MSSPACGTLSASNRRTRVLQDFLSIPNDRANSLMEKSCSSLRLYEGQHATVLQLPALPHIVNDAEEVRHAAVVGY